MSRRMKDELRAVQSLVTIALGKFRANSFKPHWDHVSEGQLLEMLDAELTEFFYEIKRRPRKPAWLAMEAADVFVVLVMIVDKELRQ